jgi:hypothetical protein
MKRGRQGVAKGDAFETRAHALIEMLNDLYPGKARHITSSKPAEKRARAELVG